MNVFLRVLQMFSLPANSSSYIYSFVIIYFFYLFSPFSLAATVPRTTTCHNRSVSCSLFPYHPVYSSQVARGREERSGYQALREDRKDPGRRALRLLCPQRWEMPPFGRMSVLKQSIYVLRAPSKPLLKTPLDEILVVRRSRLIAARRRS